MERKYWPFRDGSFEASVAVSLGHSVCWATQHLRRENARVSVSWAGGEGTLWSGLKSAIIACKSVRRRTTEDLIPYEYQYGYFRVSYFDSHFNSLRTNSVFSLRVGLSVFEIFTVAVNSSLP